MRPAYGILSGFKDPALQPVIFFSYNVTAMSGWLGKKGENIREDRAYQQHLVNKTYTLTAQNKDIIVHLNSVCEVQPDKSGRKMKISKRAATVCAMKWIHY